MESNVIVIGAGIAGLAAADALARRGRKVTLVEARARVGGRILSECRAGWPEPVELGAEFIHGGNAGLRRVLGRARIGPVPLRPAMWWREGGEVRPVPDFWDRVRRVIELVPPRRRRWSFQDFVRARAAVISAEDQRLVSWHVGSFEGASINRLSAVALRAGHAGADTEDSKIRGRYAAVADHYVNELVARNAELHLQTEVTAVNWRRGRVEVRTRSRTDGVRSSLDGAAAIVTLPVGVLRRGAVRFSPEISRQQRLLARIGWGTVVRVNLLFAPDFWRSGLLPASLAAGDGRAFGFVNCPGLPVPVWWATLAPSPILTGWAGGAAARRLTRLNGKALRNAALRSLAELGGSDMRSMAGSLFDFRFHDWQDDPYARGGYSFAAAGHEDAGAQLARPVADTLFFAGEATAEERGTVHGALASGLRAAREVSAALGRR